MEAIDINALTKEQRNALYQQMEADRKAELEKVKRERDNYQQLKAKQVESTFKELQNISSLLEAAKKKVFDNFSTILELKQELFHLSDKDMETQGSHTFTDEATGVSVIIGHNVIDGWDETVSVGQAKVNAWLEKKMDDKNANLISIIRDLLKPDKNNMLKANRVLDLSKKANEMGDAELIEAVNIIRDAYRPTKTSTFVKAKFKDENGNSVWLPLSMSAV